MQQQVVDIDGPPLARYRQLITYVPEVGDFVVWAGWFRTWYGVVNSVDPDGESVTIIFEGLPSLLFTLTADEQPKNTHEIKTGKIKSARSGSWAVMKHEKNHNATVWYI